MNLRLHNLSETLAPDEGILILSPVNLLYYTGFGIDNGALWATKEEAGFLTDFRYIEAAQREIADIPCRESRQLIDDAVEEMKARGIRKVMIESRYITLDLWNRLLRTQDELRWVGDDTLDGRIQAQRRSKEARELEKIRAAQFMTDTAFSYISKRLAPGRMERDVALDIEMFMRRGGAQDVAFDLIVASGENGSQPHAVAGERILHRGDFVTMDIGAKVDGYCSDMTRTVAIGEVSEEQKKVYETVLAAQETALRGLKPGITGEAADRFARDVIEKAGYGTAFGHSTGHGVGLEIHEFPRLSPRESAILCPGDVVTVEPGIYLPGRFGVRIEDMVVITQNGCENLTRSPKHLMVV